MDLKLLDMVPCRRQARTEEEANSVSPSRGCKGHRWERRDGKLPVRLSAPYLLIYLALPPTMRELGKTFQLSLIPSWSSTSLHCSFRASWSMISKLPWESYRERQEIKHCVRVVAEGFSGPKLKQFICSSSKYGSGRSSVW